MMNINDELKETLYEKAYENSEPFCYACYKKAPSGTCKTCHSDDLMRIMEDDGPEYGVEWIIERLIENLDPIDIDELYVDMLDDVYGTVKICGFEYSSSRALKELDPIAFRCGKADYISSLLDENIFEIGNNYYWIHDLENL